MAPKTSTLKHPSDVATKASKKGFTRTVASKVSDTYNPEAWPSWMESLGESTITEADFRRRLSISKEALKSGQVRGRFAILHRYDDGRLVEAAKVGKQGWVLTHATQESAKHTVSKEGTQWVVEIKTISSMEAFKKMTESVEWATSKLLEAQGFDGFDLGNDGLPAGGGVAGPPNNEFIPLLGGPFSKQLYLTDYLDMQAKCFWVKNHHPLGKAIVRTLRNYVIGKGITLMFKNPQCQQSWDDFVERVDFHMLLRSDAETLIWGGEIMTQKLKVAGRPSLAQIDPSTVWEVVTDPIDITNVLYYHQQYPTQWQMIYKANDKSTEYVINDIPADQVIHVKENVTPGEKRGRSDLYSVLSWLKRIRDFLNAKVTKAQIEESWALDMEVDGSQADVDRIAADNQVNRVPPAGAIRVHNKDVQYKYLQPTASSTSGKDDVAEQLLVVVAVGAGVSPEWVGAGAGAGATRATAIVKQSPANRNIEDKQRVLETYIRQVAKFVIETDMGNKNIHPQQTRPASVGKAKQLLMKRDWKNLMKEIGRLAILGNVDEETDDSFEVIFPEIATEDRSAKIGDIMKGEVARYIKHERAATMYAKEMNITQFDYDEEQKDIQAEKEAGVGPEWANKAMADQGGKGDDKGAPAQGLVDDAGGEDDPAAKPGSKASDADYKAKARK